MRQGRPTVSSPPPKRGCRRTGWCAPLALLPSLAVASPHRNHEATHRSKHRRKLARRHRLSTRGSTVLNAFSKSSDALRVSCPYEQEESNEEQHDRVGGFPAAVGGLEFRNPGSQGANVYR